MRFKFKVFFASIISFMMIYIIFVSCINLFAFNRSFYNYEYDRLNTAKNLGMSDTSLYVATDTLLDYLQGHRSNINVQVEVNQKTREVFDEREKAHMVDVKNLYQDALLVRNVMVVVVIALALFLYYDRKKEFKEVMSYAYIRIFILSLFLLSALLLYAISDFTTFWTNFHKVFFTNDLWLLNPNTSLMINMFPETFFYHLVFAIATSFIVIITSLFVYSLRYQKKLMKCNE
ncbi:MAG: TIGR01906 family membrane protein [Erysipelotrichia bacterium]|nr:TIGR01906 family membrane protein [Erysipelotrichia bacterium]